MTFDGFFARRWLPAFLLFVCLLCATAPAAAQFETAAVLGTIRDANGAPVSGATVTLKNVATGIAVSTVTKESGDYEFFNVKIGAYVVTAEADGFSKASTEKFDVTINARQRVDVALQVGQTSEVITVTGGVQLLETDSSTKGQVIERQQIVNLPLNGRSYAALALLVPGIRESQVANQGDISFRREGSFNVNGLRSTYNNFLLDGIDNNFYGTTNQGFSNQAIQPSPDQVAEVKVMTNAYSAEYGRTGGAVINVSTRSGTNEYHFTVWDFLRNTSLNATGFFRPPDCRKPQTNRNQFGFVFGGPIIKDRTFFFVDYEGSRWIQSPFQLTSVPSLAMRQGILPVNVRVPYDYVSSTGQLVTAGTVFNAGTPIPMTPLARFTMDNLPLPNRTGGGTFGVSNNFGGFARNRLFEDKYGLRLDHKFNEKISAFARFSQRKQTIKQPGLIDGPAGGNAIGQLAVFNQQGVIGTTVVFGGNSVLEVRYAVTRIGADRLPAQAGGPSLRELFGITGLPEGPRIQGGLTPQDITGFPRFGRQSTNPQAQFPTTNNIRVNYSWTIGRHSLKTGFEFVALNQAVDDTNPLYGIDVYNAGYSRPAATTANSLAFNLADFYFGARNQYQLASQRVAPIRQRMYWGYLQDDFKATRKLTINAGLRYELTTPLYDADNRLSNFDPATNSIVTSRGGGISDRSLRNLDTNNFAPRVGLAYQILDKLVVRAGYGIGYNYWNRMAGAELLSTNFPFVSRSTVTSPAFTAAAGLPQICTGNNFSNCVRLTQQGYPTTLPNNTILYQPKNFPWGYVQNWHLTFQYEVAKDMLLDVAYVGNKGVKLPMLGDLNQARPVTAAELQSGVIPTLAARRPFQGFDTISANFPGGFSNYHALQVKFVYRNSQVNLLNSFTYSKAIDNVGQVLETTNGGGPNPQNINNLAGDKGPSSFDQTFNNTTSVVWQIPVGRGRMFFGNLHPALDAVVGGWSANTIITLTSGQPLNLRYPDSAVGPLSGNLPDFLGGVALRPNVTGNPLNPNGPTFLQYFNPANITLPTPDQPFGNLGRNAIRGFSFQQVDFSVQKRFPFRFLNETAGLEFRAEFFNFFNKTNFNAPDVNRASANFGRVGSTFDPRTIQFALKFNY